MKETLQRGGRFLSGMVMPNIGAFIAWGFITALFIPDGWFPNARLAAIVGPMLTYLLPVLIGYTGGGMIAGHRGGVVGGIATIGVIAGAEVPMFLGAMIAGPIGGWVIKWFDRKAEGKIPAGFEMLVNNFSAGMLGAVLALVALVAINPLCTGINAILSAGVAFFVKHGLLPLTSIFVEPGKILFLNNAINHGIFTPLGIEQANEMGKSVFFMIESNPGPGLGLLLAYCLVGRGSAKTSAPGAAIIHFLGGIHEIYFPFVLMNPILILAMIGGGMTGVFTLQVLGGGLIAAASPGSIFAELLMTPKGGFFANIAAIVAGGAVSFVLSAVLLRVFGKESDLAASQRRIKEMKATSKGQTLESLPEAAAVDRGRVEKIVFACDAGMGSSAMGATMLRKKLKKAGITDIEVVHAPVSEIPADAQIIVTHEELKERAASANPAARLIPITNFMGAPEYDALVGELVNGQK
ncbi:MAG: PTS mannitol transporter subunit IICBA [Planctomycetota bacterium]|jgi:PTS system mannitol-specific IIC component|nr:PTS mannitol transporter subunit IICBA [Planctomycetota bacterium]